MKRDVVVIGGGFAGMFAAAKAALEGASTILIEQSHETISWFEQSSGSELLTNNSQRLRVQSKITKGAEFMETPLKLFSPNKLLIQLEGIGIPVKIIGEEFVYPMDKCSVAAEKFRAWLAHCGVQTIVDAEVTAISRKDGTITGVTFVQHEKTTAVECSAVILATGGGNRGFDLLRETDHVINPIAASQVPLVIENSPLEKITGTTLPDARLYLWADGKKKADARGVVKLIPGGIDGGAVLDLSTSVLENSEACTLSIDLLPGVDEGAFDKDLTTMISEKGTATILELLATFIPKKVADIILEHADIPNRTTGATLTGKQRKALRGSIFRMDLNLTGPFPIEQAASIAGGCDLAAINPDTMESYVAPGLFLAGDVLDIATRWGGYSIQCAISTGRCAGQVAAATAKGIA